MKAFRKVKDCGFTTQPDITLGIPLQHCSCILFNFSTTAGTVGFAHRQLHHPEKTLFLPRQWEKLGRPRTLSVRCGKTEIPSHHRHSTGFQVRVRLLQ
jgi:hypothetical protein